MLSFFYCCFTVLVQFVLFFALFRFAHCQYVISHSVLTRASHSLIFLVKDVISVDFKKPHLIPNVHYCLFPYFSLSIYPQIETHVDGQRVRYFQNDDNMGLQEMVRREKMSTAQDQNALYSRMAAKVIKYNRSIRSSPTGQEQKTKSCCFSNLQCSDIKKAQ